MVDGGADDGTRRATDAHHPRRPRRWLLVAVGVALALVAVVAVLNRAGGRDALAALDIESEPWAYVAVFLLVLGDAVIAVLPGETTLNAAATLAAQGVLALGWVVLAGALGAVVGDSTLYAIARRAGTAVGPRLDATLHDRRVAAVMASMGSSAPVLLVAGRYVPGVRFVVNASLGLARYPYRRFVLWSAIGGTLWSVYTCCLAYLVGTALAGFPLASIVLSATITTVGLAAVFVVVRRRRRSAQPRTAAGSVGQSSE
ncbi:DedA family protein [Cellulomonas sp. NPDC055163]